MEQLYTVDDLFVGKDVLVKEIYTQLLSKLREYGPVEEQPKKGSIHLAHGVGFAGVHPRKTYINLNMRSDQEIDSPRITKTEQVSRNRWHLNVKLESVADIDTELLAWLKRAYELST